MIDTCSHALPHGITLACRTAGAPGRPVLLFLHGFPEGAFVWDALLEHFADPANGGYRCVAPWMRGFGPSSAPAEVAAYRAKHLVQDIAALVDAEAGPGGALAALVAHDWGGAVAWSFANQHPTRLRQLAIVNAPHPGAFLRELNGNPAQQAASAYMNFLIRPDAEALLAEDDFRRLWQFFTAMGAEAVPGTPGAPDGAGWLTPAVKEQYRATWRAGLTGGCNYYRASPLRPPREGDPAAAAVTLPDAMLQIAVPTLLVWAEDDTALPPALAEGLEPWVPRLTVHRIPRATHWVVHEQPQRVIGLIADFLHTADATK
ncbi:alpha/beta fold hydrolase [Sphingomonas sp. NCPPB 2930]